jgi:hypothetical protein
LGNSFIVAQYLILIIKKFDVMIDAKKLGLASGIAFSVLYLGCILLMLIVGKSGTIWLFNSLLHGLDVSTISRMNVPIMDTCIGFVFTFLLAYGMGYLIGAIYNKISKNK